MSNSSKAEMSHTATFYYYCTITCQTTALNADLGISKQYD